MVRLRAQCQPVSSVDSPSVCRWTGRSLETAFLRGESRCGWTAHGLQECRASRESRESEAVGSLCMRFQHKQTVSTQTCQRLSRFCKSNGAPKHTFHVDFPIMVPRSGGILRYPSMDCTGIVVGKLPLLSKAMAGRGGSPVRGAGRGRESRVLAINRDAYRR